MKYYELNEPLHYCEQIVNYPRTAFGISLGIYVGGLVISGILMLAGFDLYPPRFSNIVFEVRTSIYTQRYKAFKTRTTAKGLLSRMPHSQQEIPMDYYEVMFQTKNRSNILTKHYLEKIADIQQKIMESKDFDRYCLRATGQPTCVPPNSLINFFMTKGKLEINDIPLTLVGIKSHPNHVASLRQLLGRDSHISKTKAFSSITRLQFLLGRPLGNSTNKREDKNAGRTYLRTTVLKVLKKIEDNPPSGIRVLFFGQAFMEQEIERFTFLDMILILGSFTSITILLCSQTHSMFLGLCGITSILGSFILTNLVYRLIVGFEYFGVFHILSIFVILGIGADNIFIFVDTWRQSGAQAYAFPTLANRLSHVYAQAAVATAQTSLTTIVAFLASAMSPLLAISSFGVFSALLVMVNYLSVIIFFPTALIFGHKVLTCCRCSCRCCCNDKELNDPQINSKLKSEASFIDSIRVKGKNQNTALNAEKSGLNSSSNSNNKEHEEDKVSITLSDAPMKFGMSTRFFRGPYFKFVIDEFMGWYILLFYFILVVVSTYYTVQLRPEDRQIAMLKSSVPIEQANYLRLHGFLAAPPDAAVIVHFDWGLKPQEFSDCRFRVDYDCPGRLRLDRTFNMNTDEAQTEILNLCDTLNKLTKNSTANLHLRMNPVTKKPMVNCFLMDMKKYFEETHNVSLPFNAANVKPFMKTKPKIYDLKVLPDDFNRYFEIMLDYWLTDGYTFRNREAFMKYNDLLGERELNVTQFIKPYGIRSYWGGALIFMTITIRTSVNAYLLAYNEGYKIAGDWDNFAAKQRPLLSPSVDKFFLEAEKWSGCAILEALTHNAVQGIIIGISTSLVILTFTTMNIYIALSATLTILLVTNSVIAAIVIADWKLGPLESINMCLVVGLAVDYVVHLAEAYNRSIHRDRYHRVWGALEEVGKSVLSGAVTSLASAIFMMFARILFLQQFGVFLFCTIAMSLIYSLGFFITLMGKFGPEGSAGSLRMWCRAARLSQITSFHKKDLKKQMK